MQFWCFVKRLVLINSNQTLYMFNVSKASPTPLDFMWKKTINYGGSNLAFSSSYNIRVSFLIDNAWLLKWWVNKYTLQCALGYLHSGEERTKTNWTVYWTTGKGSEKNLPILHLKYLSFWRTLKYCVQSYIQCNRNLHSFSENCCSYYRILRLR